MIGTPNSFKEVTRHGVKGVHMDRLPQQRPSLHNYISLYFYFTNLITNRELFVNYLQMVRTSSTNLSL